MATNQEQFCITLEAGQDLSAKQFRFMTLASDGQIDPTGDGALAVGVLQNDPDTAGHAAEVAIMGQTKVVAGGTVTGGADVASDAAGEAVAAASGDEILGTAIDGGADGEVIRIVFNPRGTA